MDATEMIEIEMQESEIRRLEAQNQSLLEEIERLRSVSDLHEMAQSDLQAELHLLQTKFSKIVLDQAMQIQELKDEVKHVADERDGLRAELDLQREEAEQLFLDLQELEKTSQEDQMELGKVMAQRAHLLEEKERWDDRVEKITEDNTVIILTMLTSQSDLEEQVNWKDATMEAFAKKVLEMVRRTRAIVDSRHVPAGGDETETSEENDDDEIGNVVRVMAAPVEQELMKIEAAVAASVDVVRRKEMVEKAVKSAAAYRKEKVVEEGAEEEMQTMIAWRPKGKADKAWRSKREVTGSRKGQSSMDSSMQKGKAVWGEWEEWDD
ncbi:hypothetical protein ACLOJK_003061 [Asimina triloba]